MRNTILALATITLLASCDNPPIEPTPPLQPDAPLFRAHGNGQAHADGGPGMWIEHAWLDGEEVAFFLQSQRLMTAADETAETPLYVIAAGATGGPAQSRAGFGPHDHTLTTEGAIRRITFVIEVGTPRNVPPSDLVLVNAADVDGDGTLDPFTSAAVIEQALAAGLVELVPTELVCPCPIVSADVPKPEPGS